MAWLIEFSETARNQFVRIDQKAREDILRFLRERIATELDPRRFGDPLKRNPFGLWKYRVGTFRLICEIQQDKLIVLVLRKGHRREVHKG